MIYLFYYNNIIIYVNALMFYIYKNITFNYFIIIIFMI